MVTIRDARLPQDAAAIRSIDTRFTTDVIYDVETADHALSLKARRLSSPLRKRFPLDDLDDAAPLVERVLGYGRDLDARHVWLETSNLNAPGVAIYAALGFRLTGIDRTLYDGTPATGETALFFSKPIG